MFILTKFIPISRFFILLIWIVSLSISCSKKDELNIEDIVMTDNQGNIINNYSSVQWNPLPMDPDGNEPFIDQLTFYIDSIYNGNNNLTLNFNCQLPDTLIILAYPNPVENIEDLKIKLVSSKKVCIYSFGYQGLIGKYPGGGSAIGEFYQNGISECKKEFNLDISDQINFPTDDMKISCTIITEDGCVYDAYGNVKVN